MKWNNELRWRLWLFLVIFAMPINLVQLSGSQTAYANVAVQNTMIEDTVQIDAVIRDFQDTHPDFEKGISGRVTGLVDSTLGPDGKPVFIASNGTGAISSKESFKQWYQDVPGVNLKTVISLPLAETSPGSGAYLYEDLSFFPIDGQLFENQGRNHNYHFTLELHISFTYRGGEEFQFIGDDDVWVFIDNRLVVDLGGVHEVVSGSVELDTLGLTRGATYSLDLFFAERHTTSSQFKILTSIDAPTTPFLELPVKYEQFEKAAAGSNKGMGPGLINTWYDHYRPDIPRLVDCKIDPGYFHDDKVTNYTGIPTNSPSNICNCILGLNCYDGHNGIDFRNSKANEPIYPAARGVVLQPVVRDCKGQGKGCGQGLGNYVWIDHQNCYSTLYTHLDSVNTFIQPGFQITDINQPLGIMGNTGNSTGVHLHFGLYKKADCSTEWNWLSKIPVDPFGWRSTEPDPAPYNTTLSLWIHSLSDQKRIDIGGGSLTSPSGSYQANLPAGAVISPITIELLTAPPVAGASAQLRHTGQSFSLRVFDWLLPGPDVLLQAALDPQFNTPITVSMKYDDGDLEHLNEQQAVIYRWDQELAQWLPLTTTINPATNTASALTTQPGNFALQAPLMCGDDIHEPNDNKDAATRASPGEPITQALISSLDNDWVQFLTMARGKYQITAQELAAAMDLHLRIIGRDGHTVLAERSSDPNGKSIINWIAPTEDTYYLQVSVNGQGATGCEALYSLQIEEGNSLPLFLPLLRR